MSLVYHTPVRELQQRITSQEFTELQAFADRYTLSPDLCQTIAGVGAAATKGEFQPDDFLPIVRDRDAEGPRRRVAQAEEALDRGQE